MSGGRTREELLKAYQVLDETVFLDRIVHDLRGPLTGIISATMLIDVLLAEDAPVDTAKIAEVNGLTRAATDTMRTILDAISDYDREQRDRGHRSGEQPAN
jgi:signal transduction histidine kinase